MIGVESGRSGYIVGPSDDARTDLTAVKATYQRPHHARTTRLDAGFLPYCGCLGRGRRGEVLWRAARDVRERRVDRALRERGGRERARDAPLEDDFTLNNSRRLAVQAPAPATLLRARPL